MPKRNILVTGANGFIGKVLISGLDRDQFNVFALDSENRKNFNDLQVEKFFLQDITTPFKLEDHFDCVFHLAALNVTHVDKAEYQEYHRVNVLGTENLIKAVNTRKFVFMSTVKVYQEQEGIIDEESPLGPQNDYERSKLEAEELCCRYFDKEDLTIFRSVNIVGHGQAEKAVIPVFFKKALNDEPLEIIYSAHTPLQILHVEDILRAFTLLLKKDQGIGIVNLCSDETITLGDLAKEIVALCRSKSLIHCKNNAEVAFTKIVSKRAKAVLGWQAQRSVKGILRSYYDLISARK